MTETNSQFCFRETLAAIARCDAYASWYWARRLARWSRIEARS